MFVLLLLLSFVPALAQTSAPATPQSVTFSDTDFTTPYTVTRVGPNTAQAQGRLSRINSGSNSYGQVTIQLNITSIGYGGYYDYGTPSQGPESPAWFFFTRPDWQLSLASGLPPTRLSFREEQLHISHTCSGCSDSMASFPAIRQGNTVFAATRLNWTNSRDWQKQSLDNLTPNDFSEFLRPGANRLNLSPNAPPLEFGFIRGFSASTTTEITVGIDNFFFTASRPTTINTTPDSYLFPDSTTATRTIPGAWGVLANDGVRTDSGGFRAVLTRQPQGRLTLRSDGGFDYTPAPNVTTDSFEYRLESPTAQSPSTLVTLRLLPPRLSCSLTPVTTQALLPVPYVQNTGFRLTVNAGGDALAGAVPVRILYKDGDSRSQSVSTLVGLGADDLIPVWDFGGGEFQLSISIGTQQDVCSTKYTIGATLKERFFIQSSVSCLAYFFLIVTGEATDYTSLSTTRDPLTSFRAYRDNVLAASPRTAHFRDLYYRHSPELISLFRQNLTLIPESISLMSSLAQSLPHIPPALESSAIALLNKLRPSMSPTLQRDFDATLIELQQPETRAALGLSSITTELITRTLTDSAGNTYSIGATAAQAFLRKTSPTHQVLFERQFGGSSFDIALGLALGPNNTVYLTGLTQSADFPTLNAAQPRYGGSGSDPLLQGDAFLTVLSTTDGRILRSTYWGGEDFDVARAIAVDSSGNAYIAGHTASTRFPISNALQTSLRGPSDAFIARFDSTTGAVLSSSYLGTDAEDAITEMALLSNGDILLAGTRLYRLNATASLYLQELATPNLTALVPLPNNEFAVAGVDETPSGLRGFLARYSSTGQLVARLPLSATDSILPSALYLRSGSLEVLGATIADSLVPEPYLARVTPTFTATSAIIPVALPSAPTPGFLTGYDSRGLLTGLPFNLTVPFLAPAPNTTPLALALATTRRPIEELSPGSLFVLSGLGKLPGLPAPSAATDSSNPPTELSGLRVRFGEQNYAALHNYQGNEIIFVAPSGITTTTLTLELNGQPIASRPIRWSLSVPQLFTTNGQADGPLLGEWIVSEDSPSRLSFFASGLAPELSATRLFLVTPSSSILELELATRTPLVGYLGIDQIVTAPLAANTPKPTGARLFLRTANRLSNPATLP